MFGVRQARLRARFALRTSFRADRHGRAAHHPAMMPTLFLYPLLGPRALGEGDRAALWRGRRLPGDTANQAPDHTTVARLHAQRA